jgi:hypothetical protein
MEKHFIVAIIFLIIAVVMAIIGFLQSKNTESNNYIQINAKLNNIFIMPRNINATKNTRRKTVYDVRIRYIYIVNGKTYYYTSTYTSVDSLQSANSYNVNNIRTDRLSVNIFYFKSNPSINKLYISKNSGVTFYILSVLFALFAIITFIVYPKMYSDKNK